MGRSGADETLAWEHQDPTLLLPQVCDSGQGTSCLFILVSSTVKNEGLEYTIFNSLSHSD